MKFNYTLLLYIALISLFAAPLVANAQMTMQSASNATNVTALLNTTNVTGQMPTVYLFATPSAISIGQSTTLALAIIGGTGPVTISWSSSLGTNMSSCLTSVTLPLTSKLPPCIVTPTSQGADTYTVSVSGSGQPNASIANALVTVNPQPAVTVVYCLQFTQNLSTVCTVRVTGRSIAPTGNVVFTTNSPGPYSFNQTSCTLNESGRCAVKYSAALAGSYLINATYRGDSNNAANSGYVAVMVNPALVTYLFANPTTINIGQQITIALTIIGGTGPLTISWSSSLGTNMSSCLPSVTLPLTSKLPPCIVTPTASGTDHYLALVSDKSGIPPLTVSSNASVTINAPPAPSQPGGGGPSTGGGVGNFGGSSKPIITPPNVIASNAISNTILPTNALNATSNSVAANSIAPKTSTTLHTTTKASTSIASNASEQNGVSNSLSASAKPPASRVAEIVVGIIVLIAIISCILYYYQDRGKKQKQQEADEQGAKDGDNKTIQKPVQTKPHDIKDKWHEAEQKDRQSQK